MNDGMVFEATKDGSIKVERCIAGVVIDKFIVKDGRPAICKRQDRWILDALRIINEPSAGIVLLLQFRPWV